MSSRMSRPSFTVREVRELKAHQLACSHLIKGCQDAVIRLRQAGAPGASERDREALEFRAVEILEDVLGSWCDTLSILRATMDPSSRFPGVQRRQTPIDGGMAGTIETDGDPAQPGAQAV
jgi:hypothetical protein